MNLKLSKRFRSLSSRMIWILLLFGVLHACSVPLKNIPEYRVGYREFGLASWYGQKFHGRPTASGEIYNMHDVSAAHKTLPLGSILRVTHAKTGKQIHVKINDRGPFVGKRIIDLSFGAAKKLGMVKAGLAEVEIELIGRAPIFLPNSNIEKEYYVQLGAYQKKENALSLKHRVSRYFQGVSVITYSTALGMLHRVQIGPYVSEKEARTTLASLLDRSALMKKVRPIVITNE